MQCDNWSDRQTDRQTNLSQQQKPLRAMYCDLRGKQTIETNTLFLASGG